MNWNDESQREREGLDLRWADLSNEDLSQLPLAKLCCGVDFLEPFHTEKPDEVTDTKIVTITRNHLFETQLQGTSFSYAQLQGANFCFAQLQRARFFFAQLQGANFNSAQLQGAVLSWAKLQDADLSNAQLQNAFFEDTQLKRVDFSEAELHGASLIGAQLQGANLSEAQLQGANLSNAELQGAKLKGVMLTDENHNSPQLSDVQWGDTNLAVVDWAQVTILGDELVAVQEIGNDDGERKAKGTRISKYKTAARAYRQLSVALRNQGLTEDAARFSYRAQLMQRKVFWLYRKFLSFFGSLFLDLLSGYGYKVGRCFIAYALVIGVFAAIYYHIGSHLAWYESIVISMTAFHGRGFFPTQFNPGDPLAIAAAIEAFVGLLIEITLIATLTQRFFGK